MLSGLPPRFWLPLLLIANVSWAETSYHVGITDRSFQPPRTEYNWRGAKTHALRTVVWYPIDRTVPMQQRWVGPPDSAFASAGRAAPNASMAPQPARFPLVLLSHGSGGSALMLAWLGTALAESGFIAAAVNHPGNNALEPYTPEGFTLWWERATDISEAITAMLKDPQFGARIDPSRIGAAGFSMGGFAVIELAGGIGIHTRYREFCESDRADEMCHSQLEFPDLADKVAAVAESEDFQRSVRESTRSHRDARIRAVFAIAPALGPAFAVEDLEKIRIPVHIVSGAEDRVVPVASSARFFAKHIPTAALDIYPRVGHYTFLATCTASGKQTQPALCQDGPEVDRDAIHARATAQAIAFFNKHLSASGAR